MQTVLFPGIFSGALLGLAFIVLNTFSENLGYLAQEILGLILMAVAVAGAQTVAVRHHPMGVSAPWLPRYFAAMIAGAAAALAYGVVMWIYFATIDKDYLARFYAQYLERAHDAVANPEESERVIAAAEKMKDFILDPFSQAMVQLGTVLVIGLLTGLVCAALVKPERAPG